MKYSEFRRWLLKQGVTLTSHKSGGSHFKAIFGDRMTVFPDHGGKEIGTGLVRKIKIKKDFGLK